MVPHDESAWRWTLLSRCSYFRTALRGSAVTAFHGKLVAPSESGGGGGGERDRRARRCVCSTRKIHPKKSPARVAIPMRWRVLCAQDKGELFRPTKGVTTTTSRYVKNLSRKTRPPHTAHSPSRQRCSSVFFRDSDFPVFFVVSPPLLHILHAIAQRGDLRISHYHLSPQTYRVSYCGCIQRPATPSPRFVTVPHNNYVL